MLQSAIGRGLAPIDEGRQGIVPPTTEAAGAGTRARSSSGDSQATVDYGGSEASLESMDSEAGTTTPASTKPARGATKKRRSSSSALENTLLASMATENALLERRLKLEQEDIAYKREQLESMRATNAMQLAMFQAMKEDRERDLKRAAQIEQVVAALVERLPAPVPK